MGCGVNISWYVKVSRTGLGSESMGFVGNDQWERSSDWYEERWLGSSGCVSAGHALPHTVFWTLWGMGWCYIELCLWCYIAFTFRAHYPQWDRDEGGRYTLKLLLSRPMRVLDVSQRKITNEILAAFENWKMLLLQAICIWW